MRHSGRAASRFVASSTASTERPAPDPVCAARLPSTADPTARVGSRAGATVPARPLAASAGLGQGQRMITRNDVLERGSRTTGRALGAVFGTVAMIRRARALHPRGAVTAATLRRLPHPPSDVAWLDVTQDVRVGVRLSRSAGLPAPLPDVLGLALAVPIGDGRRGDLLLSTAGSRPVARHLLLPARDPLRSTYTCLVPYQSDRGPVMLAALPADGDVLRLAWAEPRGPWQPFAELVLDDVPGAFGDDPSLDLDPVLHPLPGLRVPAPLARLREPAYARSRRQRHAAGDASGSTTGTVPSTQPDVQTQT